ncbi:MAG: SDR family oxidoreductase [Trueperaceae bacterium]|nr:MAG: SDR family oxidoreductase [Trueperaceae bacterium]
MRILLTGSAGFVGSHLGERLLEDGHEVVGADNYISGQRRNTAFLEDYPAFEALEADVSHAIAYQGPALDWVMHFASPASPPHYQKHPIETLMVGAQGTQNALVLAREHRAKFMLASTSEVYGDPLEHPQVETYWGNVNPIGIRGCYDEAKRYAEAITMAYHRTHGLDTRIIRIFNTYGPRMRADDGRVVTNFINQALAGEPLTVYGDGSQTRSFQYVSDLVEGIVRLMGVVHHEPVNLGNPDEYTIQAFAEIIRNRIAPAAEIRHLPMPQDDPKQRRPDITKARALLGWEPVTPLEQGLEATIAYFSKLLETAL